MKIRNINQTIYERNYSTDNIIQVVLRAFEIENDRQIRDLALKLKGNNDAETCRNIWQYLIDNVCYDADTLDQDIKTPARLIHDGVGDCKSYSLFTACILRELGIECFFRFVSYNRRKEATHVYVVAVTNGIEIPIDAVAYVQAQKPFGTEIKYNYRADMAKIGRIRYLAGIDNGNARQAARRIGTTPEDVQAFLNSDVFDVWLDGESESSLTEAKGFLLSEWDKQWSIATYGSKTERISALNFLQYISAMIRFYDEFREDNETLSLGGRIFSRLINAGAFDSQESDPSERAFFSDAQYAAVLNLIDKADAFPADTFSENWNEYIVKGNRPYTDESGETASIGSVVEQRAKLKSTGSYYIYALGIPDANKNKYGAKVSNKRSVQLGIMAVNNEVIKTIKPAEQENLLYSGCTNTWESVPSTAVKNLASGKINGTPKVGVVAETVTAVIAGVISVISGIIALVNKLKEPKQQTLKEGMFDTSDFPAVVSSGSGPEVLSASSGALMIPLLLVGAGTLFMASKKKKQKKEKV